MVARNFVLELPRRFSVPIRTIIVGLTPCREVRSHYPPKIAKNPYVGMLTNADRPTATTVLYIEQTLVSGYYSRRLPFSTCSIRANVGGSIGAFSAHESTVNVYYLFIVLPINHTPSYVSRRNISGHLTRKITRPRAIYTLTRGLKVKKNVIEVAQNGDRFRLFIINICICYQLKYDFVGGFFNSVQ